MLPVNLIRILQELHLSWQLYIYSPKEIKVHTKMLSPEKDISIVALLLAKRKYLSAETVIYYDN